VSKEGKLEVLCQEKCYNCIRALLIYVETEKQGVKGRRVHVYETFHFV